MIITKILGGTGNQLFQYAAGKALAAQSGTELKLDLTGFNDYALRNFELSRFNLSFSVASEEEITKYKAATSFSRIKARFSPASQKRFYKPPFFHFDPAFFSLRSPVYIQGYFQSEKYFLPVRQLIRDECQFREPPTANAGSFAKELQSRNSVSVHIRRGDYKNTESLRVHGVLPVAYYLKAIDHIKRNSEEGVKIYLFSDDAEAAKKLNISNAEIVSGRIAKGHFEDFYLMQHCRHNIIANSSFSWWAAWLNNHPQKTVIAPREWFNQGPQDTQDLLPEGWVRL